MNDQWSLSWGEAWRNRPAADDSMYAVERKAAPPPEDPQLEEIFSRHQAWMNTLIGNFERDLKPMVERASRATVAKLEATLAITDGAIDPTAANDKILASANSLFMDALNEEGYPELLAAYTGKFSDQFPFLQEMLDAIGAQAGRSLPAVAFTPKDLNVLGRVEAATVAKLDSLFAAGASAAMDRVMFSIAGLPFEQLVTTLADSMGKTVASARNWADTAVSMHYRTSASLQYDEIQADDPDVALKFRYSGPIDIKCRPFCLALLVAGKSYTREEISGMSNGQLPNVFVTGGGYSCRHQWDLSLK